MNKPVLTPIVLRALTRTATDIGQLTHQDRLELKRAVRSGVLSKGKGGSYPILKTVWAHPGFDFERDREEQVAEMMRAHVLDMARGVDHFFPYVPYQEVGAA